MVRHKLSAFFIRVCMVLVILAGFLAVTVFPALSTGSYCKSGHKWPGTPCRFDIPTLEQLQALDRTAFEVLYPEIYTDYEKEAVAAYFAANDALNTREPVDVRKLVDDADYRANLVGFGAVIPVTREWVLYQNNKYDPENPLRHDPAYAQSAGYKDILAFLSFGACDDILMTPWPTSVRDKLLVSDLNHSITSYKPIYPGDTLYLIANERKILDVTPVQGSTYRSVVIQTKGSVYNQNYEKVCDIVFRVTEGLSVYKDAADRPADPTFLDFWDAPDWTTRGTHYYTDADWEFIKKIWKKETIRGSKPRYWESVKIGEMPTWTLEGPIYAGLTPTSPWGMGAGGSRTIKKEVLDPDTFQTLIRSEKDGIYYLPDPEDQIPAIPDSSTSTESDTDDAGEIDPADIHAHGALVNFTGRDFAIRHITNWMGDQGWISNIGWSIMDPRAHADYGKYVPKSPLSVRYLDQLSFMRKQCKHVDAHGLTKDIALVKSIVKNKWVRNGKHEVELIWWIESIEGYIWEEGGAIVQLPSKCKKRK